MKAPANFNGLQFERDHGVTCWIDENGNIVTSETVDGLAEKVAANVAAELERQDMKNRVLGALGITLDELKVLLS